MFQRLPEATQDPVCFTIDGRGAAGGRGAARIDAGGAARGPYCLMGVCFECLVVIDGVGNRQGCLIAVEDGMRVETQRGARRLGGERPA